MEDKKIESLEIKPIQGFVALIDVLGFRNMVSGQSSAKDLKRYLSAVQEGIAGKGDNKRVKFVLFSDSIIITTVDDEDLSLRMLLRACSRLLGLLLENEIAVRGAISHGLFFREQPADGVFVAGWPIVDAYEFEQKQDWIGIMLTPSVLKAKPKLAKKCSMPKPEKIIIDEDFKSRLAWILLVQRYHEIPFHNGKFDGFVVIPTPAGPSITEFSKYLIKCNSKLDTLKRLAGDPEAQSKYAETDRWIRKLRLDWKSVSSLQDFPQAVEY
jgi:hypothetical protein